MTDPIEPILSSSKCPFTSEQLEEALRRGLARYWDEFRQSGSETAHGGKILYLESFGRSGLTLKEYIDEFYQQI